MMGTSVTTTDNVHHALMTAVSAETMSHAQHATMTSSFSHQTTHVDHSLNLETCAYRRHNEGVKGVLKGTSSMDSSAHRAMKKSHTAHHVTEMDTHAHRAVTTMSLSTVSHVSTSVQSVNARKVGKGSAHHAHSGIDQVQMGHIVRVM